MISDADVQKFRAMGLDEFGEISAGDQRTPFQDAALKALLLYTRGALKSDLSDRLVYQFAGLESLLVVGKQEQLIQNTRERIAFTIAREPEKRAEIIEAVNDAYDLRSDFVHHGNPVRDTLVFNRFAQYGHQFFVWLSQQLHIATTADFIKAIDYIKLS